MKSMVRTAKNIAETAGTSGSYAWIRGLAAALLALGAATASAEDAEAVLSLDIERQQAGSALMELAGSSGVQILVSDEAAAEVEVEGLQGQYRFDDALAALLANTRLSYHYTSEDVVLIGARQDDELEEVETVGEVEAEVEEQEPPAELAAQTVTGSRMARGDPSARIYSLSAEDIAARGVSSLEELFRTLPWAHASLTSQSDIGSGGGVLDTDANIRLGVGMSAVNLRAMGSANTLVLVNGRRVAGTAGFEDDFVNLVNVPLSAIERIDIQLDGASAVYGADAIGGVVNFITKRDYTGFSATFREEFSATDADSRNMSLKGGYAWGTGSVTASAQRNDSKPINNRKIWTSGDFRERFGPEYDTRETYHTQPGRVCEWDGGSTRHGAQCDDWNAPALSLPATHDGTDATEADFTTTITPADYVFPQNGADATNTSVSLQIEQYLTNSLRVRADAQISDTESYRESVTRFTDYLVPASNAYNPFGRHVVVSYYPVRELKNGLVSPAWMDSEDKQRNFNGGLFWQFGGGHEFEFGVTWSESTRIDKRVTPARWPSKRFDPNQEAFFAALASSDPNVAPNLFGNGTVQKSTFANLLAVTEGPTRGFSEVTSWDAQLRGEVLEAWGGPISYAIGAEFRETKIYSDSLQYAQDGSLQRDSGQEDSIGVEEPTRDSSAWFAEFAIPLVGESNARPGVRELVLSLQARRDTHKSLGATGGRESVFDPTLTSTWWEYHPDDGWVEHSGSGRWVPRGDAQLKEITRSATSPRVGLYYEPTEGLQVRAAWSQSFTPPVFEQLFNTANDEIDYPYHVDPHHPDGVKTPVQIPMVSNSFSPDVRNEHSDNYSLGIMWISQAAPGWVWSVDWSRIDFTDKIEQGSTILLADPEIAFGLPNIVKRDEKGYAVEIINKPFNLAEKVSETIDTTIEYTFSTAWGVFTPRLSYHRVLEEFYRIAPDTDRQERVGTALGSDRYKLTGHLTWTAGRFATDLYLRYTPSYTNNRTGDCGTTVAGRCTRWYDDRPPLEVDPLTTVDLTVVYRMDNGLRIRAGGRNILNADNPTVWEILPYDPTRWDARARVLYLELNWEI